MSTQPKLSELALRRGELLAELFLQELRPNYLAKSPAPDAPYDFYLGFTTADGGFNTYAVELWVTEQAVATHYALPSKAAGYLAKANIPVLLLVADTKRDRLYYAWGDSIAAPKNSNGGKLAAQVAVREIDDEVKASLRRELARNEQTAARQTARV